MVYPKWQPLTQVLGMQTGHPSTSTPAGPSRAGLDPHGAIAHWPDAKIGPGALQRAKGTSEGWGWFFFHVFDCDGQKNV
jgi:hypothetical protein